MALRDSLVTSSRRRRVGCGLARRRAWPRALNVNQRSHEGSPGPVDGVAEGRQGTHLEKRVRFSGPGSREASSISSRRRERDPRAGPRPGRRAAGREDEARRFYGELVGLEEIPKPPLLAPRGGVWFRVGVHELHVGVAEDFTPARRHTRRCSSPRRRRWASSLGGWRASGVEVAWADPAEIPGTSRFHVHDPWGNRLELVAA